MCFWTVRLLMRMPSVSSSPRRRSAPQRGRPANPLPSQATLRRLELLPPDFMLRDEGGTPTQQHAKHEPPKSTKHSDSQSAEAPRSGARFSWRQPPITTRIERVAATTNSNVPRLLPSVMHDHAETCVCSGVCAVGTSSRLSSVMCFAVNCLAAATFGVRTAEVGSSSLLPPTSLSFFHNTSSPRPPEIRCCSWATFKKSRNSSHRRAARFWIRGSPESHDDRCRCRNLPAELSMDLVEPHAAGLHTAVGPGPPGQRSGVLNVRVLARRRWALAHATPGPRRRGTSKGADDAKPRPAAR